MCGELEGVPFGSRNRINEISMEFADSKLDAQESLEQLKEFVLSVPDIPEMK